VTWRGASQPGRDDPRRGGIRSQAVGCCQPVVIRADGQVPGVIG
jgi:hypothetical protein